MKRPTPRPLPGGEQTFVRALSVPLLGGEQTSVRALSVPLLGGVRGGFRAPMRAQERKEAFHDQPKV